MRGWQAMLGVLLVVGAAACSDSPVAVIPRDTGDFTAMRDLWDAQNIDDYDIDLGIANEVSVEYTLRFEVRGGLTSRVYDVLSGWRTPSASEMRLTIDSLYARTAVQMADPAVNVVTFFDSSNGLLTYSSVDRPTVVNDAYWYTVRKFRRR